MQHFKDPLQNRVDPFGNIVKTKARGLWMGNRGKIHDGNKQITHTYKLKAWLICKLEFNGRHRTVMGPKTYTELFFLDEAAAFAAGHRPCFECRRHDYNSFKTLWIKANPKYNFDDKTSMKKIDDILHKERINKDGSKKTYLENISNLPDGSFITINTQPFLLADGKLHLWSFFGYKESRILEYNNKVTVLTPPSIIKTFQAGYIPQMKL